MAVLDEPRSLTLEFSGDKVQAGQDDQGTVITVDGRRLWLSYDAAVQFVGDTGTLAPNALLTQHMAWRFGAEWAELLRTIELSRRVREGETVDENTKLTSYAPVNVQELALPDQTPMLAWEVDLQQATGIVSKSDAVAAFVYRALPLVKGVLVVRTERPTSEAASPAIARETLDNHLKTLRFHEGVLDFTRYAMEHGWTTIGNEQQEDPTPERPPLAVAETYCQKGELRACADLGMRYFGGSAGVAQDYGKALEYFTKGCNGDDAHSCFGLAAQYANGLGVPMAKQQAVLLLKKACELGLGDACGLAQTLELELAREAKP